MIATIGTDARAATSGLARPLRILGIGGSTRQGSLTLIILETALKFAGQAGFERSAGPADPPSDRVS